MKIVNQNGLLVRSGPGLPGHLDAAQVYAVWFEKNSGNGPDAISRADLAETGLQFSDTVLTPAIIIETSAGSDGEPHIRSRLAGVTGSSFVAVNPPADYLIRDGTWYPLPPGTIGEYEVLLDAVGASGSDLTLSQYFDLLAQATGFRIDDRASPMLAASALAKQLASLPVPGLVGSPYPYQQVGIAWLRFLVRHGVGCILADEMGLGKTLQVIGVFAAEIAARRRPNLVVCPATLLENWRRELNRFAPALHVLVHAGSRRTGSIPVLAGVDVVVTSFETLAGDISIFMQVPWNVVAADEAQNLRNPEARRTLRVKQLTRRVTLAVTGTPFENRLRDLWSITDLVLPGNLGSVRDFERAHPDTEAGALDVEPLVSAIMLRRRVSEVAQDLPERIDIPVPLLLDQLSIDAYEKIRAEAARRYPQNPNLAAIVQLRLFCAHPWAAGQLKQITDPAACSPKLERCLEIVEEISQAGSKVLIFTSFNDVADLLESAISSRLRIPAAKINGDVPPADRQGIVDAFSSVQGPAMLVLNPKAAGTGLNITAANHVIHYNLEWNPAVEDQASARAYRRGQTLPVTVHRMFYAGTVEEVIDERVQRKRALAGHAVVGSAGDEEGLADIVRALQRNPCAT
jgi:SNF2 family DNA or RNA helicase